MAVSALGRAVAQDDRETTQDTAVESRASTGASTWPVGGCAPGGAGAVARPRFEFAVPARMRDWAAAEVRRGPPVAMACGRLWLWRSCSISPPSVNRSGWAALTLAALGAAIAVIARRQQRRLSGGARPLPRSPPALPPRRCTRRGSPIRCCGSSAWGVAVTGFVETREEREHNDRIVVRTHTIEGRRVEPAPQRVRVAVRTGTAPPVGAFVDVQGGSAAAARSRCGPAATISRATCIFPRIGASGFVLGAIKTAPPPAERGGAWLRYAAAVEGMRDAIDKRIRAVIPGDEGAIASALITGKRGDDFAAGQRRLLRFQPCPCAGDLRLSHGGGRPGIMFFFVRGGLALIPSLASRRPIKKWAAAAALRRRDALSGALRRRRCHPARLHHDRHRAGRRAGRSAHADVPHAEARRLRRPDRWRRRPW